MNARQVTRLAQNYRIEGLEIKDGKALGALYSDGILMRKSFCVGIRDNQFSVDIGTGSGFKVKFRLEDG
jgi:hypothetical protein